MRNLLLTVFAATLVAIPFFAGAETSPSARIDQLIDQKLKAEGLEQTARRTDDLGGHQRADAEHLVAVVGVGNDVDVLAEHIEHREAVWRKCANAA